MNIGSGRHLLNYEGSAFFLDYILKLQRIELLHKRIDAGGDISVLCGSAFSFA
jgi:hypothetical protein